MIASDWSLLDQTLVWTFNECVKGHLLEVRVGVWSRGRVVRVSVASGSWGCGSIVKKTSLLAFCQVKDGKRFIWSVLLLTDVDLDWSRTWDEILRHVKDWELLFLGGASLMLEVSLSLSSERPLLVQLVFDCWGVSSILELLGLEGWIIVNLLTSKLVLMHVITIFTQVIVTVVSASALHEMWLGKVELGLTSVDPVLHLLCTHVHGGALLECGWWAHFSHKAWLVGWNS